MLYPINPAAPVLENSPANAPGANHSYANKALSKKSLELQFTEQEAVLSWNGKQLIYFQSPVKVAGEEILDWMNKGILSELISLENIEEDEGLPIIAKEASPVYAGKRPAPERSNRSLLLNPQWFSVYFISFSDPLLEEGESAFGEEEPRNILARLLYLFEPGKALADYGNHKIFLRRLRVRPAA